MGETLDLVCSPTVANVTLCETAVTWHAFDLLNGTYRIDYSLYHETADFVARVVLATNPALPAILWEGVLWNDYGTANPSGYNVSVQATAGQVDGRPFLFRSMWYSLNITALDRFGVAPWRPPVLALSLTPPPSLALTLASFDGVGNTTRVWTAFQNILVGSISPSNASTALYDVQAEAASLTAVRWRVRFPVPSLAVFGSTNSSTITNTSVFWTMTLLADGYNYTLQFDLRDGTTPILHFFFSFSFSCHVCWCGGGMKAICIHTCVSVVLIVVLHVQCLRRGWRTHWRTLR